MNFFVSDRPLQPLIKMPLYLRNNGTVKLYWIANLTEGVDHNYTIMIFNVTSTGPVLVVNETVLTRYYLFEQCGEFDVQVKVLNEAGASQLSEAVRFSRPLLPDIQPVSDSLKHKVWKSKKMLLVLIIFEVSFCSVNINYSLTS